jgi:hypothetical protein
MFTTRPADSVKHEFSLIFGYSFRPGSSATAEVGSDQFDLFIQRDGAWIRNPADGLRMVNAAMRGQLDLLIKGVSDTAGRSTDRYSLLGITKALARIEQDCPIVPKPIASQVKLVEVRTPYPTLQPQLKEIILSNNGDMVVREVIIGADPSRADGKCAASPGDYRVVKRFPVSLKPYDSITVRGDLASIVARIVWYACFSSAEPFASSHVDCDFVDGGACPPDCCCAVIIRTQGNSVLYDPRADSLPESAGAPWSPIGSL